MNQNYSFKPNVHTLAKLAPPRLHSVYPAILNLFLLKMFFIIINVKLHVLQHIMTRIKFVLLAVVNVWNVILVDVVNAVINMK